MIYLLDKTNANDYSNVWNYTFIVVAIVAILIGAAFTYKKLKKASRRRYNRQK